MMRVSDQQQQDDEVEGATIGSCTTSFDETERIQQHHGTDNERDDDDGEDEIQGTQQLRSYHSLWRIRQSRICVSALLVMTSVVVSIFAVAALVYVYTSSNNNDVQQVPAQPPTQPQRISSKLNNATLPQWKALPDTSQILTRIAFGSCATQEMPQPYWDTIHGKYNPDILILAGDNVYGDCNTNDTSCYHLREAYKTMADHASVQGGAMLLPVYATLDDHDYGLNDCDETNPFKDIARELFAEFFNIPWSELQAKDGVYRSNIWGIDNHKLQIILLDTRYSRSPFNKTGNHSAPYTPYTSESSDQQQQYRRMLSDKQWIWFEEQLQLPADLRLVVSSIQVLTATSSFECWRQLPHEQERLLRLIHNKSVLLLSGDVHRGSFYELNEYYIELTSSSLTHTEPIGDNYRTNCTSIDVCDVHDPNRVAGIDPVHFNNFGTIDIDWMNRTVQLALRHAETTFGSSYYIVPPSQSSHVMNQGNAGEIIVSRSYSFPF